MIGSFARVDMKKKLPGLSHRLNLANARHKIDGIFRRGHSVKINVRLLEIKYMYSGPLQGKQRISHVSVAVVCL